MTEQNTGIVPAELEEQRGQVAALTKASHMFEVAIPEDVRRGEEFLRDIKHVQKAVEERKTIITRPLMASLASVRDLFKPFELGLADAQKIVKAKILAYTIAEEAKALAAAEKIEERVEKGLMRADTAAGKLASIDANLTRASTRTVKKLLITDEPLIPREFLLVDRKAVTEALWAGVPVPGASLIEEKILITK